MILMPFDLSVWGFLKSDEFLSISSKLGPFSNKILIIESFLGDNSLVVSPLSPPLSSFSMDLGLLLTNLIWLFWCSIEAWELVVLCCSSSGSKVMSMLITYGYWYSTKPSFSWCNAPRVSFNKSWFFGRLAPWFILGDAESRDGAPSPCCSICCICFVPIGAGILAFFLLPRPALDYILEPSKAPWCCGGMIFLVVAGKLFL